MSNGRNRASKQASGRDAGGFVALPWSVLDSASYARLSKPARALLLELARQYVRDNNGRLLLTMDYLSPRGWKSADVVDRAKRQLLQGGFIHETVKGHRPNKASWYAVTWHPLDRIPGYDPGAAESFTRSAYRPMPAATKPTRDELYAKWSGSKNAPLTPSDGTESPPIAPSHGAGSPASAPSHGAIRATFRPCSAPSDGNHLDMPSAGEHLKH